MNAMTDTTSNRYDAVIVGAGFAGLYMLHKLRGMGRRAIVIEAGDDVGGTWYWNRYPGARCDAESTLYSYSFSHELEQEWSWSERYATQPEILSYLQHVADRFDLRRDIRFGARVTAAAHDATRNVWAIEADHGDAIEARWFILATGNLSIGRLPDIAGIHDTTIPVYHTGSWPHDGVDFSGLDVGIVGTGSSGIQAIPEIARQAAHLTVYQRTASFTVPARNAPLDADTYAILKRDYPELRKDWRTGVLIGAGEGVALGNRFRRDVATTEHSHEERTAEYERRWQSGGAFFSGAYNDLVTSDAANDTAADFIRGKIREIVADPDIAEALTPRGFPVGTKRLAVDTDYYETFNRPNVTLVSLASDPIERIAGDGVVTASGHHRHDALVFATGFDAMTGAVERIAIANDDGTTLASEWAAGPLTYLGLMTAGFPNLLFLAGPGSPSVLGNVVCHIEQHVEFVADLIADTEAHGLDRIDVTRDEQATWVEHVNAVAAATLYPKANSWYLGANVPGKPRVFMPYAGGIGAYREACEKIAADDYRGFVRSAS